MTNELVRATAKASGVKLWRVAEVLGVTDSAFSRKLRHTLSESDHKQVLTIIAKLAGERSLPEGK